jgi:hypothetical protein
VYGFEKSALDNISPKQLKAFKDAAKIVLNLSDEKLTTAIKEGAFIEVPKPGPAEKK